MLTKVDQETALRWRKLGAQIGRKACHGSAHAPVDTQLEWERSGWYDYLRILDALKLERPTFSPSSGRLVQPDLGRVLEWGAGAGRLTPFLLDAATEVVNVDASPALLALCPMMGPLRLIVSSDPTELPAALSGGKYDVVVSLHVLYSMHPDGVAETIRSLAGVLADDGAMVLDIPVRDDEPHHEDPDPEGLPGGWWVHSFRGVKQAAAEAGLEVATRPHLLGYRVHWSDLAPLALWTLRRPS